ncbi:restriction endonuclease subunit S [Oscillospiraceae bacterium 42-9]
MVSENVAYQLHNLEEAEIDESPVKWCSVTLSDIVARGKRLEASVYDVEAKQAREIVTHGKYPAISLGGDDGLTSSYTGARFKRIWVEHSDYPIYQPSSIVDVKPTPDGYISESTDTNIDALRVKKGQILMTCSGTIGKVAYVSDTLDGLIFSHDLLRIDSKDDNTGYIYAYLKSKIGQQILLTNSYGAVITHIEPEHLADVPIPDAPVEIKQEIHKMVIDSYVLRDESNKLLDEAMDLLVQELKLPPVEEIRVDDFVQDAPVETFLVKLSQLNNRVDASYHVPVVKAIVDYLEKNAAEVTTIGDCRISRDVILPGRFKRVYVSEGYGRVFFGGKQILELDPTNSKYLSVTQHSKRMEEELQLKENMTLITRSGTIGKVALVPKHWANWIASEDVLRVLPADRNIAGYLYVWLMSDFGQKLLDRYSYGSVISHVDNMHIKQIAIPILKNQQMQQEINDRALNANQKRYEAYLLEQKALEIMDRKVLFAK